VPLRAPEDVIPHLGRPTHWKQGRSAKALADRWFHADGIPHSVRNVLGQSDFLASAELLDGWLERETDLRDSRATPSQTDLLALLGIGEELGVLGVEAKVDESFGPLVSDWLADLTPGKVQRLTKLCELFRVRAADIGHLRYQLLHRSAAVIHEALRFRSDVAVLVVQSFCPQNSGLSDASTFFETVGLGPLEAGGLIGPRQFGGVTFWAGWASDMVPKGIAITGRTAEVLP
jgi:hypothetical protein